ncbi:uncharacterized protein METZ01_LOCUS134150, partial [marine metagenome]
MATRPNNLKALSYKIRLPYRFSSNVRSISTIMILYKFLEVTLSWVMKQVRAKLSCHLTPACHRLRHHHP